MLFTQADSVRRVPTPSSVTESSSTIQEEEGPSLLRVETLSGEEGRLGGSITSWSVHPSCLLLLLGRRATRMSID